MPKKAKFHIVVKRINNNQFLVEDQVFDFLELINWFRDVVTD